MRGPVFAQVLYLLYLLYLLLIIIYLFYLFILFIYLFILSFFRTLRRMFFYARQLVSEKFPTHAHKVVGGFYFLRFLCPALYTFNFDYIYFYIF